MRARWLLWLSALLLVCACAPRTVGLRAGPLPRRRATPSARARPTAPPPPVQRGALDPRLMLEALDRHLRGAGYQPIGPAIHGSLAAGGLIAYGTEIDADSCYAVAGLGAQGEDLNLVVLDPQGRTIGHDVSPGPYASSSVCPGVAGRMVGRLQLAQGRGEYYYAVYRGERSRSARLGEFFGRSSEPRPRAVSADPVVQARLDPLHGALEREGYLRASQPAGLALRAQEPREYALSLRERSCYAFLALSGSGVEQTRLELRDGEGQVLAASEPARDSSLRHCSSQRGAYVLRVIPARGEGPVFTLAYRKPDAPEPAAVRSAPAAPAAPAVLSDESRAASGLEDTFRLLEGDMRARGYLPHGEQARGTLREGEGRALPIELTGGKCYAILAVGDGGVGDLDLALEDAGGRGLDRDVEGHARPIVRTCPERSGSFRIQLRMQRGGGGYVYQAFRWPRGTQGPFGLKGLIYVRLAEVTSLLGVEGYAPDADYALGRSALAQEGARERQTLKLRGGRCYSLLVVGDQGVQDLDLALSRDGQSLGEDGSRNPFPSVRHCTRGDESLSLDVRASRGAGPYVYQVFRRVD